MARIRLVRVSAVSEQASTAAMQMSTNTPPAISSVVPIS